VRLRDMGISEKLPDNDINACRVWMGTVGARCGKIKQDDIVALWNYLRESMPILGEALAELEGRHKVNLKLGFGGTAFLEGIPVQKIMQEARRVPNSSKRSPD